MRRLYAWLHLIPVCLAVSIFIGTPIHEGIHIWQARSYGCEVSRVDFFGCWSDDGVMETSDNILTVPAACIHTLCAPGKPLDGYNAAHESIETLPQIVQLIVTVCGGVGMTIVWINLTERSDK